jgi:hypothetical protein
MAEQPDVAEPSHVAKRNEEDWDQNWADGWADDIADDAATPEPEPSTEAPVVAEADDQEPQETPWDEDWEEPKDAPRPLLQTPQPTPENVTAPFRADEWDSSWEEPPTEATAIQQPAIQPTIEPDEPTIDEIVAAANRSLSPEDQRVVDVKAIAIESPHRELSLQSPVRKPPDAPSKSPWDDWDDEDSNWAD